MPRLPLRLQHNHLTNRLQRSIGPNSQVVVALQGRKPWLDAHAAPCIDVLDARSSLQYR